MHRDTKSNPKGLRVIRTARDEKSINRAASEGLRPLVKKVEASPEIRSKFAIWQNEKTGKIEVSGDYRSSYDVGEGMVKVIDWSYFYPNPFKNPFAAYLIPPDMAVGERVFLEDLIEDRIGASWNQGDTMRLESAEAIWNGEDFEIQIEPKNLRFFIG